MSTLNRIARMFDFNALRQSLKSLEARLAAIQVEYQDLTSLRNRVLTAPAAKVDVKAMLEKWVDATAGTFVPSLQASIGEFIRVPQSMGSEGYVQRLVTLCGQDHVAGDVAAPNLDRALCALFPAQVKQALSKAVDAMDWGSAGLPLAQRDAEIARIDERIQALLAEESELREKAREAGITTV